MMMTMNEDEKPFFCVYFLRIKQTLKLKKNLTLIVLQFNEVKEFLPLTLTPI
jgi:hypothetical protein